MRQRLTSIVNDRQFHWKDEWDVGLRAQPAVTVMAEPAILVHLMDETFAQFCSLLRTRPGARWLREHPASFPRLRHCCRCGLNPLLAYFATGQVALENVLRESPAVPVGQCTALKMLWHFLAQREIESLCGACPRVCAPVRVMSKDVVVAGEFGHER